MIAAAQIPAAPQPAHRAAGLRPAAYRDRPGVGAGEAEHHVDRRRLARAVRAEQRDRLTGSNRQVDRPDRAHLAVGLRQPGQDDPAGLSIVMNHGNQRGLTPSRRVVPRLTGSG